MSQSDSHDLTPALTLLMAAGCGVMVANIYFAQTLLDMIAPEIRMSAWVAGGIVTLTQLGYGLGLALIVPLSDLFENKRMILIATAGAVLSCIGVALATNAAMFLLASILLGLCSVGAQILLPLATHLSSHARQGRTIGLVMSGLLTGIMLARPFASFVAEIAGWRAVFLVSAALMAVIGAALFAWLPQRRPQGGMSYAAILGSSVAMFGKHRALRLRATYQSLMFVAFNLFWTAAPLVLLRQFQFSHAAVALFALAGAGGALAAPLAGYLADHGKARVTTLFAMALLGVSFLAAGWSVAAGSVIAFTLTAILIDSAVQLSQISGQRIIFGLDPAARGRVNAAYMTIIFAIGPLGSLIGSASYQQGGWQLSAGIGAGIGAILLILFALFERQPRPAQAFDTATGRSATSSSAPLK